MKKKFGIFILVALLILCSAAMAACADKDGSGLFGDYNRKEEIKEEVKIDADEGMKFDGIFDEALWQDLNWVEMKSLESNRDERYDMVHLDDCNVRATGTMTDKGMYYAMETDDPIIWTGDATDIRDPFQKTGMSVYIADYVYKNIAEGSFEFGFAADGTYALRKFFLGGYKNYPVMNIGLGVHIDGAVNTDGNGGYSLEVFIPWSSLGYDAKPERIRSMFTIERNEKAENESPFAWELIGKPLGVTWDSVGTWHVFDENGFYIAPEGENFGHYKDKTYTDGFDLSHDNGENPYVDSTAGADAKLYVKDFYDTVQYAETTIKINEIYNNDGFPKVGFMFAGDPATIGGETHSRSVMATFDISADGKRINGFYSTESQLDQFSTWDWESSKIISVANAFSVTAQAATIAVYRNGEKFYYFVNGILVGENAYEYIAADTKTFAAILSFNVGARYSDYIFLTGEDASAKGNSMISSATPSHYDIDGDESDWSDYSGTVIGSWAYDGSGKEFTVKSILKDDGLYFLTKAKHGLYLSGNAQITWNSSIEIGLTTQNGTASLSLFAAPGRADIMTAVMKTDDSGVSGSPTRYTSVIEGYIPMDLLDYMNAVVDGKVRIGFAWRTGNGDETVNVKDDPDGSALDSTKYEVIMSRGRNADKPYIWHPYNSAPWETDKRSYVGAEGITVSGRAEERTVDGKSEDWNNFNGYTAKAEGVATIKDGEVTIDDRGYGFTSMLHKGRDGLYFYTVAKHRKYKISDETVGWQSNFVIEAGISKNSDNTAVGSVRQFFFTPEGCIPHGVAIDYVMRTVGSDAEGYTTITEGFIPNAELVNPNDEVFDKATGLAKDGYSVRVGVAWRTRDDNLQIQNRGYDCYWQTPETEGWNIPNMLYCDEDGLRTSQYKPEAFTIDGNADDWSKVGVFDSRTGNDSTLGSDQQRSVETKVAYKDEGLYFVTVAKTYSVVGFNYQTGAPNNGNAFRNTSVELQIEKSGGGNAQLWFASYGNVLPGKIESRCEITSESVTVGGEPRTRYTVVIEGFISQAAIRQLAGLDNPDSLSMLAVFANVNPQNDGVSGQYSDPIDGGAVNGNTASFWGTFGSYHTVNKS